MTTARIDTFSLHPPFHLPNQNNPLTPAPATATIMRHLNTRPPPAPGALEKAQMKRVDLLLVAVMTIAAFGSMDSYAQYVATRHVRPAVRNGGAALVETCPPAS